MPNNRKSHKIIFALFILLSHSVFARYDSTYIAPFEQDFSIGFGTSYQFTMLTHKTDDKHSTAYLPNIPVSLGLSASYKKFSISGGMSFEFMRIKEHGETRAFDWQIHHYGRKYIFDFYFKNYEGFYIRKNDETIILHPDIRLLQYGMSGQYIFNYKEFSYKAVFNRSERQLKSAGSFQVGGGFYYNHVASDTSLTFQKLNNYQFSLSGGYIYAWVIERDFYVAFGMSAGLCVGTETRKIENIKLSPTIFPRISAGYSADGWSFGLSFLVNRTYLSHNAKLNTIFDTGYTEMCFIKRFNKSPKFLHRAKFLN